MMALSTLHSLCGLCVRVTVRLVSLSVVLTAMSSAVVLSFSVLYYMVTAAACGVCLLCGCRWFILK